MQMEPGEGGVGSQDVFTPVMFARTGDGVGMKWRIRGGLVVRLLARALECI